MKKSVLYIFLCCSLAATAQTHYNLKHMQREELGRGVVAFRSSEDSVTVSWRYLDSDPEKMEFDVLQDGKVVAHRTATESTQVTLPLTNKNTASTYTVKPSKGKVSGSWTLPADAPIGYLDIPVTKPADQTDINGKLVTYSANDASMADLDGDGEMEIILKWDPSNSKDNSQSGITNNTYIEAYKTSPIPSNGRGDSSLSSKPLWRIDLGRNIRSGAHYTQFMCYDLDGDGKAEVVMKTGDGTVDGQGKVIGDANADYRVGVVDRSETYYNSQKYPHERFRGEGRKRGGFILGAHEYLTVFDGLTGAEINTVDYIPQQGKVRDWGDNYANRSERYLACVAYLDGKKPSVIMCRGYYTRTVLAAWDFKDKKLVQRWVFDTNDERWHDYAGQGNHNLRVADIDGDGKDEITYGSCAINDDGTGLYNTHLGHGDAIHLTAFKPLDDHLYVWDCHEDQHCSEFRDGQTGQTLWTIPAMDDVGRCMAADIDPSNPGLEMWSSRSGGILNTDQKVLGSKARIPMNFGVWWDGDLLREMLDYETVSKYATSTNSSESDSEPSTHNSNLTPLLYMEGCKFNNGTKSNPCLACDILGDWREEVLTRTEDSSSLRLYISPISTPYRFHTFLQDPVYRHCVTTQNVGYNQPTQVGFYFGAELQGSGKKFRGWQF